MHHLSAPTPSPEQRLAAIGATLPPPRPPIGAFATALREGTLLFLSGQGPVTADGLRATGRVGEEVTTTEAADHARLTTMNLLGVLRYHLGSLDQVDQVVKVLGMVNSSPDFTDHETVMAGCTDLLLSVFGPVAGKAAGSVFGLGSLPNGITVEIEMIVRVKSSGPV